jgi:hypothetical protein
MHNRFSSSVTSSSAETVGVLLPLLKRFKGRIHRRITRVPRKKIWHDNAVPFNAPSRAHRVPWKNIWRVDSVPSHPARAVFRLRPLAKIS